jgi:hypothetical protein|tara:strand:- start:16029 stop:16652 length:624 start_codon:yes stop_codon:yes gene_type:complete
MSFAPFKIIALSQSENWMRFREEFQARAFFLTENHHQIFSSSAALLRELGPIRMRNAVELLEEKLRPYYPKKTWKFTTASDEDVAEVLFTGLLDVAYDMYAIYARTTEEAKETGLRMPRKKDGNSYEILWKGKKDKAFNTLPRQARLILEFFKEKQDAGIRLDQVSAEKLIEEIRGQLKTKQGPWRVFKFYQARLIQGDFLRLRNIV